jgi:hypothetical protein
VFGGEAERRGEVRRLDGAGLSRWFIVGVEGSGRVGVVAAQVGADVRKDFAGAKDGVGRSGMRDHFAFDSILLVSEREGGLRVAVHVDVILQGATVHGATPHVFRSGPHVTGDVGTTDIRARRAMILPSDLAAAVLRNAPQDGRYTLLGFFNTFLQGAPGGTAADIATTSSVHGTCILFFA